MFNFEGYNNQDNSSLEKKEERLKTLEHLAVQAGFEETPEMRELEQEITEVPGEKYEAWREFAEDQVEASPDYIRAQIALLIAETAIYLRIGNDAAFSDHLNDAIEYANSVGFEDMVKSLEQL
ncbi:MAG: hypothetical protein WDZ40_00810 [Candidatus Spechtbacterales bacterium]